MVDWWRSSLEVGGVELVEVLSKAPPEGMTQQQELTWARRRLKLSTHSQTPFQSRPTCLLFQWNFLDPNCSVLSNMWTAAVASCSG